MMGIDAVQTEFIERILQDSSRRFGAIPVAPIRLANPVAQNRVFIFPVQTKSNCSDKLAIRFECDGKFDPFALFKTFLVRTNPLLRHSVLVRMGNERGSGGYGPVTGEKLHARGVTQLEWAKHEPPGLKRGALLS